MDLHRFEMILMDFESPKGLGGSSWFFLGVQVGPEESPGVLGRPREVLWGALKTVIFFFLEVNLSMVQ